MSDGIVKSAVFDLDGTLADTSGDLIEAANKCFRNLGFDNPLNPDRDRKYAFKGGRRMLEVGHCRIHGRKATHNWLNRQYQSLLQAYDVDIDRHTYLYDEVEQVLDNLSSSGWVLGVCTNKPEGLALKLLARLGILSRFRTVVGADSFPYRKPDPRVFFRTLERMKGKPTGSLLIGDSIVDSQTARAASIPFVLVEMDESTNDREAIGAESRIQHFGQLPAVAEKIVEGAGDRLKLI